MDTQLLRAFIAVAHNLSFTKAAEELGTTQPLLSRSIRRLEDIVGEALFDRSKRRIALTAPGLALLDEAPAILDHAGLAIRRSQLAGRGTPHTLRIGYAATMGMSPAYRGIRKFRAVHPEVSLDFRLIGPNDQGTALRCGEIDAILMGLTKCDRRDLAWRVIGREPYVMALPSDWPLEMGRPVDLSLYKDRPFVLPDPVLAPEAHAAGLACCVAAGFQPRIAQYIRDASEMRFLVASGLGAGFAYGSSLQTESGGVRYAPIEKLPAESHVEIELVWADRALPPALRAFVDCMVSKSYVTEIESLPDRYALNWTHVAGKGLTGGKLRDDSGRR